MVTLQTGWGAFRAGTLPAPLLPAFTTCYPTHDTQPSSSIVLSRRRRCRHPQNPALPPYRERHRPISRMGILPLSLPPQRTSPDPNERLPPLFELHTHPSTKYLAQPLTQKDESQYPSPLRWTACRVAGTWLGRPYHRGPKQSSLLDVEHRARVRESYRGGSLVGLAAGRARWFCDRGVWGCGGGGVVVCGFQLSFV